MTSQSSAHDNDARAEELARQIIEQAEGDRAAAADGDHGRSYEAAVARLARSQPRPVMRLEGGKGIVTFLGEKFAERDAAEAAGREAGS
jgi:hypothetical protein